MQTFSKKEAIKYGWQKMKENFLFFAGLISIVVLAGFIFGFLEDAVGESSFSVSFILNIVNFVFNIVITIGATKIVLDVYDKGESSYSILLSEYRLFFRFVAGYILYSLIVLAGFILFVIPGIIWAVKFSLWSYLIVDKNMGPIEALKASSKATDGNKWNLFSFGILLGFINILGALALIIGLFATIPIVLMAFVFVYRKLVGGIEADVSLPIEGLNIVHSPERV